jgi:hypothetical protein
VGFFCLQVSKLVNCYDASAPPLVIIPGTQDEVAHTMSKLVWGNDYEPVGSRYVMFASTLIFAPLLYLW